MRNLFHFISYSLLFNYKFRISFRHGLHTTHLILVRITQKFITLVMVFLNGTIDSKHYSRLVIGNAAIETLIMMLIKYVTFKLVRKLCNFKFLSFLKWNAQVERKEVEEKIMREVSYLVFATPPWALIYEDYRHSCRFIKFELIYSH